MPTFTSAQQEGSVPDVILGTEEEEPSRKWETKSPCGGGEINKIK